MAKRLLCTADLHLGRESSGFPGCDSLGAWSRMVDRAVESSADAVLVAGDFFDSDAAQYAVRADVRRTLERLRAAGIAVVAVAGNHDSHALRVFSRYCDGLITLLGVAGAPSMVDIKGFRVVGASFERPDDHGLLDRLPVVSVGSPVVGLLHGDIDGTDRRYNPFSGAELTGRGVDSWVLGHIHVRREFASFSASYPGSPQALDPGETGLHGFHWLEIDDRGGLSSPIFEPVSDVRYENLTIELPAGELLDDAVVRAADRFDDFPGKLGLRLRVLWSGERPKLPEGVVDWHRGVFQVVSDAPAASVALPALASGSDARGQAARLLLGLDGLGEADWVSRAQELVKTVLARMEPVCKKVRVAADERFVGLRVPDLDSAREAVRGSLLAVLAGEEG